MNRREREAEAWAAVIRRTYRPRSAREPAIGADFGPQGATGVVLAVGAVVMLAVVARNRRIRRG